MQGSTQKGIGTDAVVQKMILGLKEGILGINFIWWAMKGTIGSNKAYGPFLNQV